MNLSTRADGLLDATDTVFGNGLANKSAFGWLALATVTYWALRSYYYGQSRNLRHIPTAIGTDLPILSYVGAIKYMMNTPECVEEGIKMTNSLPFKVADLLQWTVVISDPKMIEEFKKFPDDVLSNLDAVDEITQSKYTFGEHVNHNPIHIPLVRTQLPRALPKIVPIMYDEIREAFNEYILLSEDWTPMKAMTTSQKIISRASNRMLIGLPLCRDPDYLDLSVRFTVDTMITATILRFVPQAVRSFVNSLLTTHPKLYKRAEKHLAPLIAARRAEQGGDDEQNDFLSWLMKVAQDEEESDWRLTTRIMTLNLASIHTTAITFMHTLYYLAVLPSTLLPELREEVEQAIERHGWTREGLDAMEKVDSLIKESQRLHPSGCLMSQRKTRKTIIASDGTTIPPGTLVAFATRPSHIDETNYEDPLRFDPFRFVKMKDHSVSADSHPNTESESTPGKPRFDIISLNKGWHAFGSGRHACPGRFFAAAELKAMIAHLVVTYDVRLEGLNEGHESVEMRPRDLWILTSCLPNTEARVMFRKRKA